MMVAEGDDDDIHDSNDIMFMSLNSALLRLYCGYTLK